MHRYTRYIFSVIFSFVLILTPVFSILPSPLVAQHASADQALTTAQANRAELEQELADLEAQIAEKQQELSTQKGQSVSLSRDIAILTTKIQKAKLDIQAQTIIINKLGGEITQKNQQIQTLSEKITSEKESLAQLIRQDRELDNKSILTLVLSQDTISDAYGDIDTFASLKRSIQTSVDEINGAKTQTQVQEADLQKQKNQAVDAQVQLENSQHQIQVSEQQQQQLLAISKDKEKQYQAILDQQAARRAQILAALFDLRDVSAIPFGKALDYAKTAQQATGVDPAFLLAILTQESNLGSNEGSCYVTNLDTGAGMSSKSSATYPNVMKAPRDTAPFQDITLALGRDPTKTLVSCPFGSSGYGGAMGPAQFIPSTWMLLKDRIASALGIVTPDPWYPQDAFMASALYLSDLGASGGSYSNERNAACKYYSGRSCDSRKPANSFYGDSVMAKAKSIQQTMIDPLQN
jgi:membrane-bound lytic murein transglycosylase B